MNKALIPGGYVLQPRKLDESEIMHEPPIVREVWLYLCRKVNHKANGKFDRGSGFFRFEDIQEDLHWYVGYRKEKYSKPQLTKSLRKLREAHMIATTKATRGMLVTICNYSVYQDPKNYEGNNEGTAKETVLKKGGRTINKNDKNVKNDNKKEIMFEESSNEYQLSLHLFNWIKHHNPKAKNPNFVKWCKDFDKLLRIDKLTPKEIADVIDTAQSDNFWYKNILSPSKLRDKWDKLILIKNGSQNGFNKINNQNEQSGEYGLDTDREQEIDNLFNQF